MLRYDIINWLIEKYGYKTYLEIGVEKGETFNRIECQYKEGVDPNSDACKINAITSDEFFANTPSDFEYDLIFVDGLHQEDQVKRDIENSLKHLAEGGTIVVHDCNPPAQRHACHVPQIYKKHPDGTEYVVWNGTAWKAFVMLRLHRDDLEIRCVDADWGCGIIRRGKALPCDRPRFSEDQDQEHLTYPIFDIHRAKYLNLISVAEFKEIYNGL